MMLQLFPLLLLISALLSIFLYQRTNHEVHLVLGIFIGIVCILWMLTIAHWSIHLLGLLALLCFRIPMFNAKTVNVYQDR